MPDYPADVDLDLDRPDSPDSGSPPPRNRPPLALFVVVGVLLIALGAAYLFLWRGRPEPAVRTAVAKPQAPVQHAEPAEQIVLPPLDETDALVRELVNRLSSEPAVTAWLTTDGLLLNFVTVTSRIAQGRSAISELKAIGPVPRFRPRTVADRLYIDPSSYHRYDRYAAAVSSLDARGTARLYATLKPRIADAYKRHGHPDGNFDPVLERALIELLAVPVIEGDVALEPAGIGYAFADERLQGLSAPQKQLLRMGPENMRTVQRKLREIASAVGIPESRLPR
jgi:hypothetical protein